MAQTTDIYFDFEFIDDGREIVPISLGMCVADPHGFGEVMEVPGKELYLEYEFDPARANDWVREHVFPQLGDRGKTRGPGWGHTRGMAAQEIAGWVSRRCGDTKPKFWGYYPSYDWVLLCQHFGTLMQRPKGWPKRPMCLKQQAEACGLMIDQYPMQPEGQHHALVDAKWNRDLHKAIVNSV